MKVGVIGAGGVGTATIMALIMRGTAREIVIIDKDDKRALAVATDFQYGTTLATATHIHAGHYDDLNDAQLIIITAGVNEKTGGATNRNDPQGRLKLLKINADIYHDIVSSIAASAPYATVLVVTDPPDPLADLTRQMLKHDRVVSAGTFLDSLRFQFHLAQYFNLNPKSVTAQVIGEHGTSEVFLWSQVIIGGTPLADLLKNQRIDFESLKKEIEGNVRFANITIIEGNNASQYGIGMATARIADAILLDEQVAIPIGFYHTEFGVTLSSPAIVGSKGITRPLNFSMSTEENQGFTHSAEVLKSALATIATS